jgi:hypothetical protein
MNRIGRVIAWAFGFSYLIYLYLTIPNVWQRRAHNPEIVINKAAT